MARTQWKNGVGKRCVEGKHPCTKFPYCDPIEHPFWIKAQVQGDRKRGYGPVTDFRQFWPGGQQPKTWREAEMLRGKVLEALGSPGGLTPPPPPKHENPNTFTVETLITNYRRFRERKAAKAQKKLRQKARKQENDEHSKLTRTIAHFGHLTIAEFQAQGEALLERFVDSYTERGRKAASAYAVLATILKPSVMWGAAQDPQIITRNPFSKYRFPIVKNSTPRTERCDPDREYRLFEALRGIPDSVVGGIRLYASWQSVIHFCEAAIDLGPRKEELLQLNNEHVDWQRHVLILQDTKYAGETRLVPFNPDGRVAHYLETRRFAGRQAPLFLRAEGDRLCERDLDATWVYGVCAMEHLPFEMVTGTGGLPTPETMEGYKTFGFVRHSLRAEAATWLAWCGMSEKDIDFMCGWERQWTQGRYRHDRLRQVLRELAEHVWPKETERAQPDRKVATR